MSESSKVVTRWSWWRWTTKNNNN